MTHDKLKRFVLNQYVLFYKPFREIVDKITANRVGIKRYILLCITVMQDLRTSVFPGLSGNFWGATWPLFFQNTGCPNKVLVVSGSVMRKNALKMRRMGKLNRIIQIRTTASCQMPWSVLGWESRKNTYCSHTSVLRAIDLLPNSKSFLSINSIFNLDIYHKNSNTFCWLCLQLKRFFAKIQYNTIQYNTIEYNNMVILC